MTQYQKKREGRRDRVKYLESNRQLERKREWEREGEWDI
jgi:hypothetical protein